MTSPLHVHMYTMPQKHSVVGDYAWDAAAGRMTFGFETFELGPLKMGMGRKEKSYDFFWADASVRAFDGCGCVYAWMDACAAWGADQWASFIRLSIVRLMMDSILYMHTRQIACARSSAGGADTHAARDQGMMMMMCDV